jgi:hypothetical protein
MDHQPVKKNGFAGDADLNGPEQSVAAGDRNPTVILPDVHLRASEEVPNLPAGKEMGDQSYGRENDKKSA